MLDVAAASFSCVTQPGTGFADAGKITGETQHDALACVVVHVASRSTLIYNSASSQAVLLNNSEIVPSAAGIGNMQTPLL